MNKKYTIYNITSCGEEHPIQIPIALTTNVTPAQDNFFYAILSNLLDSALGDSYIEEVAIINARTPSPTPLGYGAYKWRVTYNTINGQFFTDLSGAKVSLLSSGSNELDITAGVGLQLKNALDNRIVDPNGDVGIVASIHLVIR